MLHAADRTKAARSNLIAGLPQDVQESLLDSASIRNFNRGATIFLQGEPAVVFYVVLEGWAKLYRIAPNGTEVVVNCFTEGQSFAEAAVLQRASFPVHAEAATDCRLVTIDGRILTELMDRRPEVTRSIVASMYMHFHQLVGQIESLKAKSGSQRVANFLLELCPDETRSCTVVLPYDKTLIAGRLGMKPESLSRAFARLTANGVTVQQNRASIEDVDRLRAYTEEDSADARSRRD